MDSKIHQWMEQYTRALRDTFGSRLWFVGLQGSYARGEATAQSDIDAVVILDRVSPADLAAYSAMLDRLPDRDKVCGFISGKDELFSWEPSDLFQFLYDTTPVLGSLKPLRERVSREDIRRAAWTGLCNVYHLCAHNMVHEKTRRFSKACISLQPLPCRQFAISKPAFMRKLGKSWRPACSLMTGKF